MTEAAGWLVKLHGFGLSLIGLVAVGRLIYLMGNPFHYTPIDYVGQVWTIMWWLDGVGIWTAFIFMIYGIRSLIRKRTTNADL